MIELDKGQDLPLDVTLLRVGLGWDKEGTAGFLGTGKADVDLDASALQFAGAQFFDIAFYNNLATRDGSTTHLGDNLTGHGKGDDEEITVDLGAVYGQVDQIVFLISSYQGHSLEWVGRAYVRVITGDDSDGDEAGTELARLTLTGDMAQTGVVLAKLVRTGDGWTFRAVGQGIDAKIPTESIDAVRRFL